MGILSEKQAVRERAAKISSKTIHQGKFISLVQDQICYADGECHLWDKVTHPGAVAVVPITENGDLVLIEQWRRTVQQVTLEIPAGLIDPGETIEECAQRELQEEIGQKAKQIDYLGWVFTSPAILTEKIHIFVAKDLHPRKLHAEDTDKIDIRVVSLKDAFMYIKNGTIVDAKTVLAILRIGQSC